jgi:hypothetical protein
MQTVSILYPAPAKPVTVDVFTAAKDARMYRIAARKLRKDGYPAQARKCERNARACERAIVQRATTICALAAKCGTNVPGVAAMLGDD